MLIAIANMADEASRENCDRLWPSWRRPLDASPVPLETRVLTRVAASGTIEAPEIQSIAGVRSLALARVIFNI
jgi:hypothetical protein